jgi:lipooligosaccharide transport system permease protein
VNLSYRTYYIWKRNLYSFKRFVVPTVLVSLSEPFFYLVAMGLGLGSYLGLFGGKSYLYFLAPALIMSSAMLSATMECLYGSFLRMVHEKIYDSLLVTPILAEEVIAGDIAWGVTRGIFSGLLMLLVAWLLKILTVSPLGLLALLAVMAATGLLFASLSMIITAYAPNFDFFSYYTELVITPIFFFSEVFFPLEKMPQWVKILSQFSPLTHAVIISRSVFAGVFNLEMVYRFLALAAPASIFFALAIFCMKRRLIK